MSSEAKLPKGGNEESTGGDFSLGNTFSAFENRLQRKLKEQEKKEDVSEQKKKQRHTRMLQAMNTIRKALQDTCKIRLGDRFQFELDVTDWQGWPRVDLNLVDSLAPERTDYALIVSANDRSEKGNIVISMADAKVLATCHLCDIEEMKRLPLVLKKTVRDFLDLVADYVLNPPRPEDILDVQAQEIDVEEDQVDSSLKEVNVFSDDDLIADKNLVDTEEQEGAGTAINVNVFEHPE
jgi:hypothetical protein